MNKLELAFNFITEKVRKILGAAECSRCHVKNQQLHDGLCQKCEIIIELSGAQEELRNLRARPLGGQNNNQAQKHFMRITELESEIPRLTGKLDAFNSIRNDNFNQTKLFIGIALLVAFIVVLLYRTWLSSDNPKIADFKLKNENGEYTTYERNYFGNYIGEVTISDYNSQNKNEYFLTIHTYQDNDIPSSETQIALERKKEIYSFIIPNDRIKICKNLIVKAEICLIKNNICYGDTIATKEITEIVSCGE